MSRTNARPKIKTKPWDSAAYLKTDGDIAHYWKPYSKTAIQAYPAVRELCSMQRCRRSVHSIHFMPDGGRDATLPRGRGCKARRRLQAKQILRQ